MRRTVTFRDGVLTTAEAMAVDPAKREAVQDLLGEAAARSESARLDQLAALGALMVNRTAEEKAYADLATHLTGHPAPAYRQDAMGAPIEGERDEDLERLFRVLDS